jgi:hypothetical protein
VPSAPLCPHTLPAPPCDGVADAELKKSLLEDMLLVWHQNLVGETEVEFIAAIKRFASLFGHAHGCPQVSLCAGSAIDARAHAAISRVWESLYGIHFKWVNVLSAELDERKRIFLKTEHALSFLVSDIKELEDDIAVNQMEMMERGSQPIPFFRDMGCGIPCTSRTPLSMKAKQNLNCVQEERSATGTAAGSVLRIAYRHWPDMLTFECVTQLFQQSGDNNTSDAQYIVDDLRSKGFWAFADTLDARHFGARAPRARAWWAAARHLKGTNDEITHFFLKVLNAFKVPRPVHTIQQLLILDDDERQKVLDDLHMPRLAGTGLRLPKRGENDEPKWKPVHMNLFRRSGLEWPPALEADDWRHIKPDGLFRRELELVMILDYMFVPSEGRDVEFLDVNPKVERLLQGCFEEDNGEEGDGVGDFDLIIKKSPWQADPPTVVGSAKLVVREVLPGGVKIRALEAVEYMALQGWDRSEWAVKASFDTRRMNLGSQEYVELVANLAGNAWSIWHYVPFKLALCATIGRFHSGLEEGELVGHEQSQSSDGSSGCSDGRADSSVSD